MSSCPASRPVLVVGAGISGIACARALRDAGVPVRVVERGRVVGGRMASRRLEERPVDLGAAFFTADLGGPFGRVVRGWLDRGVAAPWTDTMSVSDDGGPLVPKAGPLRYAAPAGLRSLIVDLADGLDIELQHPVAGPLEAGDEHAVTVLAMPDPQARRLLSDDHPVRARLDDESGWAPTIAVALGWPDRAWPDFHGAFVNDSPALSFLADDGDRRGDGAPVLVAHSSAVLAREHLEDPDAAIAPITETVRALLDIGDAPSWSHAHRWTFARPIAAHPEPFLLEEGIAVCGDAWGSNSSVGTAWRSGDALGREIASRLA